MIRPYVIRIDIEDTHHDSLHTLNKFFNEIKNNQKIYPLSY
jgi:hypothetical protein